MSWWDFGESSGQFGGDLALYQITCGFCDERGRLEIMHHFEHKKNRKTLNYDTCKCSQCGNYTMVFWSASSSGGSRGLHDYIAVQWPKKTTSFPEFWPADVGRYWLQARRSLETQNWDAAAVMARSAIQLVMRDQNAVGSNLKQEVDDLASKGILPPVMKEWAHHVRELGNSSAHPQPGAAATSAADAKDVVEFLSFLLRVTYTIPNDIQKFRERKK